MSERPEWFAPKRYGFGAGLPIAWQGWALLTLTIAAILVCSLLLAQRSVLAAFVVTSLVTALFLIVVAKTTKGGWKWRWGDDR